MGHYRKKIALLLMAGFCWVGCKREEKLITQPVFCACAPQSQNVGIADKITVPVLVSNPKNHTLAYAFSAERGQIIGQKIDSPTAQYVAPFSGGSDTLRVTIYDQNDKMNLPQIQHSILVAGDGVAFVELPQDSTGLADTENGIIKVTGVGGTSSQPREVAKGRQPTISPDGRYLAYTYYTSSKTAQIRVQDAAGTVTVVTGSDTAVNRDPVWAPIGNDRQLYLAFSSDRSSVCKTVDCKERGSDFNLWKVNALGQDISPLLNTPGDDFEPTWSPDGRDVTYRSNYTEKQVSAFWNLWRLNTKNQQQQQITFGTQSDSGAFEPAYSPDGIRIVYSRQYLSKQPQNTFKFRKVWMLDMSKIDLTQVMLGISLSLPPTSLGNIDTVANRNSNFGQIVTQEFDEGTVETSPSFSVDGRTISYVRARGQEYSAVSVPSNPGNLGTIGLEPFPIPGLTQSIEVDWAKQPRSFGGTGYGGY